MEVCSYTRSKLFVIFEFWIVSSMSKVALRVILWASRECIREDIRFPQVVVHHEVIFGEESEPAGHALAQVRTLQMRTLHRRSQRCVTQGGGSSLAPAASRAMPTASHSVCPQP